MHVRPTGRGLKNTSHGALGGEIFLKCKQKFFRQKGRFAQKTQKGEFFVTGVFEPLPTDVSSLTSLLDA